MKYRDELKQSEVDWKWERSKYGEELTLTHIPTGKSLSSLLRKSSYNPATVAVKKKELYDNLFDALEEAVYGPD